MASVDYSADKNLSAQYIRWTSDAIIKMQDIVARYSSASDDEKPTLIEELYGLAHNIKGMGSSFNYPLMTEAGLSLCRYLKGLTQTDVASVRVMDAHVRLFDVVIKNNIQGTIDEKGKQLLDRLNEFISES